MNMLIADSGSTKTEWCYLDDDANAHTFYTKGLNPYYNTKESLIETIREGITHVVNGDVKPAIFFYGAGCSLPEKKALIREAFEVVFRSADIFVNDDLIGAARALCGHNRGIAAILGTGSNSCLFDGTNIVENIPSLGFVLGDEGSGGFIGKQIVRAYFYAELPKEIILYMEREFNMNRKYVLDNIYHVSQANRYVASFASVTSKFAQHPFIKQLVHDGFEEFITSHVLKYTDCENYEVGFIGSVAYFHQDTMEKVLEKYGLSAGQFLKQPMQKLIEYHSLTHEESN